MSCNFFPYNPVTDSIAKKALENPAFQIFGNRFFSDQTHSELLVEFLIVAFSTKKIGPFPEFHSCLPNFSDLNVWLDEKLEYSPKARLNLKLFSLLGASKLDTRHKTHRDHHQDLIKELKKRIHIMDSSENKDAVVRTLENLFLGFQGAGSGRTWCAQSFIPISNSFLAGETIWNESQARKHAPQHWDDIITSLTTFLTMNKHRFLARGGEVLYLQICNALRQPKDKIKEWAAFSDLGFSDDELDPKKLHENLEKELCRMMKYCPKALTDIAEFIDEGLDSDTSEKTDGPKHNRRFVNAGWCRVESWKEGYIFAVEIYRLLKAGIDIMDRIHLLEIACAMQVIRSLVSQSSRILKLECMENKPGYRLVVSSPADDRPAIRRLSQLSVKKIEKLIYQALRSEHVDLPKDNEKVIKLLNQADRSYGGKLFISLSKRIGFMIPRLGAGARFVLNEQMLRFLVITTIPLGGRLTFDTFKQILENRHGLVFDADGMNRASEWLTGTGLYLPADTDSWLQDMLEAAGFLIQLSDSCALVSNPADVIEKEV
jgi:hypothetical protein